MEGIDWREAGTKLGSLNPHVKKCELHAVVSPEPMTVIAPSERTHRAACQEGV